MELIPIVDSKTLELKGFAERKWAEKNYLCHLTTLLIPVFCKDGRVALQVRPEGKSFAGCYDFFGGHVSLDEEFWKILMGGKVDLHSIVWSAAVREANEELRVTKKDCYPEIITREHLAIIGDIGDFLLSWDQNIERSTLFLVKIPRGCFIHPMDDVKGKFVKLRTEFLFFHEIQEKYITGQWNFAAGADRILQRFQEDTSLFEKFTRFIKTMCEQ